MGIIVTWDNEDHTILRFVFDKHWTWADVANAKLNCDAMIDGVPHRSVSIIYDAPPDVALPSDMLRNARRVLSTNHPKAARLVFVLTNPIARLMINTLARISGSLGARMHVVDTVDEARQFIAERSADV